LPRRFRRVSASPRKEIERAIVADGAAEYPARPAVGGPPQKRLTAVGEPIPGVPPAVAHMAENLRVKSVGSRTRIDQRLRARRSPNSAAKSEVRSSTDSAFHSHQVLRAAIASSRERGARKGSWQMLLPTPVCTHAIHPENVGIGRWPLDVNCRHRWCWREITTPASGRNSTR